jgi:hypothetical protein
MHQRGNGVFAASFLTLDHEWIKRLFAIYGWMVFCFTSTDLVRFVQNLVDWAFGMMGSFVQNVVELLPGG